MSEGVGEAARDGNIGRRSRIEFVRVRMADETCVLELGRVERLVSDAEMTRVPRSSSVIAGVTAVGSDVAPVVDGRTLLGLPLRSPEEAPTLLLIERDGGARPASSSTGSSVSRHTTSTACCRRTGAVTGSPGPTDGGTARS